PPPTNDNAVDWPLQIVRAVAVAEVGFVEFGLTVILTDAEFAAAHTPLCTTARNHVSETSAPIDTPVSVVVVLAMSVGNVNAASLDFCHFTTLPVCTLNVRSAGLLPLQMVCAEATAPPTLTGSTVILTDAEFAAAHTPLCTTARNHVSETCAPIDAPVSVVVVLAMSVGNVNAASLDFCHFTTLPVCTLNVRSAGLLPLQMVCAEATAPPTLTGSTVILTDAEFAAAHTPLCTTARNHVSETCAPIDAPVSVVVVLAMSVGNVNAASLDFCHFTTLPVCTLNVRSAGLLPLQMVCAEATAPPTLTGSTVILTDAEFAAAHTPLCTTARNHVSETCAPIDAPVSVVVVLAMSVGNVNAASLDFCHFTTLPVCTLNVRSAGLLPLQMVCAEATAPPTLTGSTVILTDAEFAAAHTPLCTTARNHVSETCAPIDAPVSVVVVLAMSVGNVNAASLDFCHFTTLPVCALKVRSAGLLPLQIVCAEATVPPTLTGSTVILTDAEFAAAHTPLCTTARNHVSETSAPIDTPVSVVVVLAMSVGDVNAASLDCCHFTTLPVCA